MIVYFFQKGKWNTSLIHNHVSHSACSFPACNAFYKNIQYHRKTHQYRPKIDFCIISLIFIFRSSSVFSAFSISAMTYIILSVSCYVAFDIINFLLCHLRHNEFSIMSLTTLWISYYATYGIMDFLLCHL